MSNPMDEWVPGKYDRREPPQADIMSMLGAYRDEVSAGRRDRENAAGERAQMRTDLKSMMEKIEHLEEKIEPLTEALLMGRLLRWIFFALIGAMVALATAWTWVKANMIGIVSR